MVVVLVGFLTMAAEANRDGIGLSSNGSQEYTSANPKIRTRNRSLLAFLVSVLTCSRETGSQSTLKYVRGREEANVNTQQEETSSRLQKSDTPILPPISQQSLLLSEDLRTFLHPALPALVHGRRWILLYSSQRDGISLLTLYRKSCEIPGLCLLVAGDSQGAAFGALVPAPLKPSSTKKYQGSNETFVFTDVSGIPRLFRSTGANRYFVLCTTGALALGGGRHFALYLDGDLLSGSSGESETFGNCCLANAEDFSLKEVELWGFEHVSRYCTKKV